MHDGVEQQQIQQKLYRDQLFAALDRDGAMERIGGGNETEVYRSDDRRFVVKIKSDTGGPIAAALQQAQSLRAAAERFAAYLGPRHSLPSHYMIAGETAEHAQVVIVQPYAIAQPLFALNYATLSKGERTVLAQQLREVVRRSLEQYRASGEMPDLYGRSSASTAERIRMRSVAMLPKRLWSFLALRNLLRSHNLLVVREGELRVVLVDYDPVRRGRLYRTIYYLVRWALFFRDHTLIVLMQRGMPIPRGE